MLMLDDVIKEEVLNLIKFVVFMFCYFYHCTLVMYDNVISGMRFGSSYYDRMSGALMLDSVRVAEVYSHTGDPDHYQVHQAAVTAVVECPKGGSVWVQCLHGDGQIYGTGTEPRSVFTGFAITFYIHP